MKFNFKNYQNNLKLKVKINDNLDSDEIVIII